MKFCHFSDHKKKSAGIKDPGSYPEVGEGFKEKADFCTKSPLDNYLDLLKLFLPDILVEHFDLTQSKQEGETLHLYFDEQNKPPIEYALKILISKGFHDEITIQDFPLRGKRVFLHIKR